jgi:peptidoglycan/LPS O-acetylase OafA/YrhL
VNSRTIISIIAAFAIAAIAFEKTKSMPVITWVLRNPVLVFLGKISYGLYLYHTVVDIFFYHVVRDFLNPHLPAFLMNQQALLYLAECSIMLLAIATFSYYVIEMPFLRMKRLFNYT